MPPEWFGPTTQHSNVNNKDHGGVTAGWAWWGVMTTISVVNLIILLVVLKRYPVARIPPTWEVRARRVAAIVFTIVCAYRSILPRVDVTRLCFFDTPLNWIIFGRTGTCVAVLF